jgi:hypothetical protein
MKPTAEAWSKASPSSYVASVFSYSDSGERRPTDDGAAVIETHPHVARHDPLARRHVRPQVA